MAPAEAAASTAVALPAAVALSAAVVSAAVVSTPALAGGFGNAEFVTLGSGPSLISSLYVEFAGRHEIPTSRLGSSWPS